LGPTRSCSSLLVGFAPVLRTRRWLKAAIALLLLSSVSVHGQDAPKGMNFNFYHIDTSAVPNCASEGKGAPFRNSPRLTRYDDPAVRQESQADLTQLAREKITWIRTLVWFAPKALAPLSFVTGKDEDRAARNLAQLGEDLATAGMTDWVVAFGPLGKASPSCRKRVYGDCFDRDSVQESTEFILRVRRGLEGKVHPRLWVDLSNEGCFPRRAKNASNQTVIDAKTTYLIELIRRYVKVFPSDRISISCVGDKELDWRLDAIQNLLKENGGVSPAFLDAHIYDRPNRSVESVSSVLGSRARAAGKPFIVGETNILRPEIEKRILNGLESVQARPAAIIYWPLNNPNSSCGADHEENLENGQ